MQALSLVSWRLVLVDTVMMLYLLALFGITRAKGVNMSTNVFVNALLKYGPCVLPH
jgi:hypothetical protein